MCSILQQTETLSQNISWICSHVPFRTTQLPLASVLSSSFCSCFSNSSAFMFSSACSSFWTPRNISLYMYTLFSRPSTLSPFLTLGPSTSPCLRHTTFLSFLSVLLILSFSLRRLLLPFHFFLLFLIPFFVYSSFTSFPLLLFFRSYTQISPLHHRL
jgi:hypothetical protein